MYAWLWTRRTRRGRAASNGNTRSAISGSSGLGARCTAGRASCPAACGSATDPEVLFLDEPFGALDALTRANLQQELLRLCSVAGRRVTTVMITNNIEEALLLSDRIIPMTRGPRARLGASVTVDLAKPRVPEQLLHDEASIRARAHVVECLTDQLHHRRADGSIHESSEVLSAFRLRVKLRRTAVALAKAVASRAEGQV